MMVNQFVIISVIYVSIWKRNNSKTRILITTIQDEILGHLTIIPTLRMTGLAMAIKISKISKTSKIERVARVVIEKRVDSIEIAEKIERVEKRKTKIHVRVVRIGNPSQNHDHDQGHDQDQNTGQVAIQTVIQTPVQVQARVMRVRARVQSQIHGEVRMRKADQT